MSFGPNPITCADLWRSMACPSAASIYDICTAEDHAEFPRLVPGAQRITQAELPSIQGAAVIICQKGKKLSQGAAALLSDRGLHAHYLDGGIEAWAEHALPTRASEDAQRSNHWVLPDSEMAPWIRYLIRLLYGVSQHVMIVDPTQSQAAAGRFSARHVQTVTELMQIADSDHAVWASATKTMERFRPTLKTATLGEAEVICRLALRRAIDEGCGQ